MTNPNLKIPLALLKKYKLSTLAILIYGELNGLYSKYHKCEITDKQLTQRLNRSNTRVQYGLNELKKNNLIFSKQKPNYRGRSIQVPQINDKKYILVPVSIIRNKDLSQNALLVYGSLYSRFQKQIKINRDKRIDDDSPSLIISKTEIAQEINKSSRFIGTKLNELKERGYIDANSIKGVGIEISFLPVDNSIKNGRPCKKVGTERVSTYEQNGQPHRNKTGIHIGTERATNKVLININKETHIHSSSSNKDLVGVHTALEEFLLNPENSFDDLASLSCPVYYDSIPDEKDMPPISVAESPKDINDLNKLDAEHSTTHPPKTQKSNNTAKSGSEESNSKTFNNSASKTKTDQTPNKDAQSANKINYIDYNGFNIDYQCKTLQDILRRCTGKPYIITFNLKALIKARLDSGLTLYDFESAINYLIKQGKTIYIKDIAINLPNYLSKINSN
ncbi:hypothetical protein [Lactobacillus gallinarum]|uniref:hypothetical protein n=1 Tax=Lactobacillus gallinarum TaxID=52242 RepID=UPI00242DEFB7|nr:hypothetical protein [Lactobacillus gallinarum]